MTALDFTIWIDNDACPRPVREVIFKASKRLSVPVKIVANSYMHPPSGLDVQVICVSGGFDAADDRIVEEATCGDIVITADVPLADRVVQNGAVALSPRGKLFDEDNIKEELTMRNLRQELRSAGEITGGPKAFDAADLKRFASAFDRLLASRQKV